MTIVLILLYRYLGLSGLVILLSIVVPDDIQAGLQGRLIVESKDVRGHYFDFSGSLHREEKEFITFCSRFQRSPTTSR